ncbi:MAG: hypothetical protein ACP5HG_09215 [Anaerolineae bacterium]
MSTTGDLADHNRQVLACQEEAFTLAAYLLADDEAADAAVQQACLRAYQRHRRRPDTSVRLLIFREVISLCARPIGQGVGGPLGALLDLTSRERQSLLLVDLLGLSYADATEVLRCTQRQLTRWLASARSSLVQSAERGGRAELPSKSEKPSPVSA